MYDKVYHLTSRLYERLGKILSSVLAVIDSCRLIWRRDKAKVSYNTWYNGGAGVVRQSEHGIEDKAMIVICNRFYSVRALSIPVTTLDRFFGFILSLTFINSTYRTRRLSSRTCIKSTFACLTGSAFLILKRLVGES